MTGGARLDGPPGTVALLELYRPATTGPPGSATIPARPAPAPDYAPPAGGVICPWTDMAAAVGGGGGVVRV